MRGGHPTRHAGWRLARNANQQANHHRRHPGIRRDLDGEQDRIGQLPAERRFEQDRPIKIAGHESLLHRPGAHLDKCFQRIGYRHRRRASGAEILVVESHPFATGAERGDSDVGDPLNFELSGRIGNACRNVLMPLSKTPPLGLVAAHP
jgi:hypothetical protein